MVSGEWKFSNTSLLFYMGFGLIICFHNVFISCVQTCYNIINSILHSVIWLCKVRYNITKTYSQRPKGVSEGFIPSKRAKKYCALQLKLCVCHSCQVRFKTNKTNMLHFSQTAFKPFSTQFFLLCIHFLFSFHPADEMSFLDNHFLLIMCT